MKKEGLLTGIILLIILLLASACLKPKGEEYFPMSDGARWEYATKFCSKGNCNEGKLTKLIDGVETINGKEYFKSVTVQGEALEQTVNYNRKVKEGILSLSGKHKDKPEQLVMPLPLTAGKTWTYQSYEPVLITNESSVVEKETLYLHDKKYENCLKVSTKGVFEEGKLKGIKGEGITYYAPNIGMVKSFINLPSIKSNFAQTLTKYEP